LHADNHGARIWEFHEPDGKGFLADGQLAERA
jgi:hypothetical protein